MFRYALILFGGAAVAAQDALSLRDAVRLRAPRESRPSPPLPPPSMPRGARIDQARGGRLPKVNYSESFDRRQ